MAGRRPPQAAETPLVVLEGGPRGGIRVRGELRTATWYTAAGWAAQRAAAEWSRRVHWHQVTHPSCTALRYVETAEWVPHPRPVEWPQGGTVWRWTPGPADE